MPSKAQLLLVTGVLPSPPDQGDRLRLAALTDALAKAGELRVLYFGPRAAAAPAAFAPWTGRVDAFPRAPLRQYLGLLRGLGREPFTVAAHWDATLARRMARALESPPRLLVAYQLRAARYAAALPAAYRVVDLTDRLAAYYRRARRFSASPLLRLRFAGIHRAEAAVDTWADEIWLAALGEAAAFTRGRLVPNGTRVPPAPQPLPPGPPRLLYVGNRRYPPNRDGLNWFLTRVWPLLRRERPDALLEVVGRGKPVRAPGVVDAGYVADVVGAYRRCHLVLAPVRFGAGAPSKVLEALGQGRVVAATPAAASGLAVPAGCLATASCPAELAATIGDLLAHPEELARRGTAAHAWAAREADWSAVMARAVEQALAGAGADAP